MKKEKSAKTSIVLSEEKCFSDKLTLKSKILFTFPFIFIPPGIPDPKETVPP